MLSEANVEWGFDEYKTNKGKQFVIRTSHSPEKVDRTTAGNNELDLFRSIHTHTNANENQASGFEYINNGKIFSTGSNDCVFINDTYNKFKEAGKVYPNQYPLFFIYNTGSQRLIKYTYNNAKSSSRKITKASDLLR